MLVIRRGLRIGVSVEAYRCGLYKRQARFNHRKGCCNRAVGIVNFTTIRACFKRLNHELESVIAVGVVRKVSGFQQGEVSTGVLGDAGQAQDVPEIGRAHV